LIYTHLAASFLGAAIAFAGAWQAQSWRYGEQIEAMKFEQSEAAHKLFEAAQREQDRLQAKKDEALNAAKKRETQLRIDAADSRYQLDRLRLELANGIDRMPSESCNATRERSKAVSELFGQCATEITGLAETLDRVESERQTLIQAWPK